MQNRGKCRLCCFGAELIPFLAALAIFHQDELHQDDSKTRMNSSYSSLVPPLGDSWQEKSRESGFGPAARKQDGGPRGGQEPVIRESATAHPGGQEQAQQREDCLTR